MCTVAWVDGCHGGLQAVFVLLTVAAIVTTGLVLLSEHKHVLFFVPMVAVLSLPILIVLS